MIAIENIPIPFRLDFLNLAADDTASFCVAVLFAITINAESQAFGIEVGKPGPDVIGVLVGDVQKYRVIPAFFKLRINGPGHHIPAGQFF